MSNLSSPAGIFLELQSFKMIHFIHAHVQPPINSPKEASEIRKKNVHVKCYFLIAKSLSHKEENDRLFFFFLELAVYHVKEKRKRKICNFRNVN